MSAFLKCGASPAIRPAGMVGITLGAVGIPVGSLEGSAGTVISEFSPGFVGRGVGVCCGVETGVRVGGSPAVPVWVGLGV